MLSMEHTLIKPKIITIQQLRSFRNRPVKPIDDLNIPNITVPSHLAAGVRHKFVTNTVATMIRAQLNIATFDNVGVIKEKIKNIIVSTALTTPLVTEAAIEIFNSALSLEDDTQIGMYMEIYNHVNKHAVEEILSVGNLFIKKCKETILSKTSFDNIRKLASMDITDYDVMDKYNREKQQICNLLCIISILYGQRKKPMYKITSPNFLSVLSYMLDNHKKVTDMITNLGQLTDDLDDEEYDRIYNESEILAKMHDLIAEQLCACISYCGQDFINDDTVHNGITSKRIINAFKRLVIPTITDGSIKYRCSELNI